ncbi:MAG: hypothetical protein HKM87_06445 [Ignavibacteriaceae bacterium]|nr:hypothetical protein [Ignavibacteriaceae bacterium]
MRLEKIYIQIFFLSFTLFLVGCRLLTGDNTDPKSVVQVDYANDFVITSPERASFWRPGESLEIKWITSGSVEKVDIQLYRKTILIMDVKDKLSNSGSFTWEIPNDINHSLHYHIKILNHNNPEEYELSDRFAIID